RSRGMASAPPPSQGCSTGCPSRLSHGDDQASQVPGEPSCVHAPLFDPGELFTPGPPRRVDTAFRHVYDAGARGPDLAGLNPAAPAGTGAQAAQARGFLSLHRRSVRGTPVAHGTAPARRAHHRGDDLRTSTTLTVAAALATIASQAGATTFVAMTERALARAADAIVVGTVRYIESVAAPDGAINTLVTVEVE